MYFDKRTIYILLAIMVVVGLVENLNSTNAILAMLFTIPGVLIAITFHEFAHAIVADKLGDDTPRSEGRISLNPLTHIDPIGFVMLLFAGFGWGKPVHVNPRNYNRTMSMDKADAIVSVAGPAMNFILAIAFAIIYFSIYKFAGNAIYLSQAGSIIMQMIIYTITINIGLGVFNLIPLPPLDGSKIIKPLLSYNAKTWFESNEKIFYAIFIILWITNIAGMIISPIIGGIYSGLMNVGMLLFNI